MRRPHRHKDPDWQMHGVNEYHQCECGARRVRCRYLRIASPVTSSWPQLVDKHGRRIYDTGWVTDKAGDQ